MDRLQLGLLAKYSSCIISGGFYLGDIQTPKGASRRQAGIGKPSIKLPTTVYVDFPVSVKFHVNIYSCEEGKEDGQMKCSERRIIIIMTKFS